MLVSGNTLIRKFGINCTKDQYCLGFSNSETSCTLCFLDDQKYLDGLIANNNICAIFTTNNLSNYINGIDKEVFIVDDPRFIFFTIFNFIAKSNYIKHSSNIEKSASIHQSSFVSDFNVKIGSNTVIHPNVTILPDVEIGDNCVIQSGTVIGSEGFEYKRTKSGILSVFHNGKVVIGNNVEIGANTCIDKGFSFKNTIIENDVKIDNLIHIAHGVKIMNGAFIIAGTILGGSTTIGENSWLSINSSIAPGIEIKRKGFVSIGSVVTKNVESDQQVTGNFAIPHDLFLKDLKSKLKK